MLSSAALEYNSAIFKRENLFWERRNRFWVGEITKVSSARVFVRRHQKRPENQKSLLWPNPGRDECVRQSSGDVDISTFTEFLAMCCTCSQVDLAIYRLTRKCEENSLQWFENSCKSQYFKVFISKKPWTQSKVEVSMSLIRNVENYRAVRTIISLHWTQLPQHRLIRAEMAISFST